MTMSLSMMFPNFNKSDLITMFTISLVIDQNS